MSATWRCPTCGQFLRDDAVQSEDYMDPGAYYGVSVRIWADCVRDGRVDNPALVPLAEAAAR